MYPNAGDLVFIPIGEKRRPVMVIKVFEVRGVPYNWLGIPITSSTTIGENLIEVSHPKLTKRSFCKLIDPMTFKYNKGIEVQSPFEQCYYDEVMLNFLNLLR